MAHDYSNCCNSCCYNSKTHVTVSVNTIFPSNNISFCPRIQKDLWHKLTCLFSDFMEIAVYPVVETRIFDLCG